MIVKQVIIYAHRYILTERYSNLFARPTYLPNSFIGYYMLNGPCKNCCFLLKKRISNFNYDDIFKEI